MKNLIVFLLAFCILNAQARPATFTRNTLTTPPVKEALAKAYNVLSYKLNSEWNQKDKDFHSAAMKTFRQEITELRKEGLTTTMLFDFLAENIPDEKVKTDFLAVIESEEVANLDSQEAMSYVMDNVDLTAEKGSAFTSSGVILGSAALLGALALLLAIECEDETECFGGGYEVCTDYYDAYYGWYLYTDCVWVY